MEPVGYAITDYFKSNVYNIVTGLLFEVFIFPLENIEYSVTFHTIRWEQYTEVIHV
jgi:hypothetical protein